jgi:hypothetical protein
LRGEAVDTVKGAYIYLGRGEDIDAFEEIKSKIQDTQAHDSQDTDF